MRVRACVWKHLVTGRYSAKEDIALSVCLKSVGVSAHSACSFIPFRPLCIADLSYFQRVYAIAHIYIP